MITFSPFWFVTATSYVAELSSDVFSVPVARTVSPGKTGARKRVLSLPPRSHDPPNERVINSDTSASTSIPCAMVLPYGVPRANSSSM